MPSAIEGERRQPLTDAWWELGLPKVSPPTDAPIFAPYEKTRPGFELINAALCEPGLAGEDFKDAGDGFFEVCLWDIWHWAEGEAKGKPKPDPAEEDPEKEKINDMQQALGELSDDDRLVRVQTACLVRCHFTYPRNIDVVLEGIASGVPNIDEYVSCEPPWCSSLLPLLRALRGHPLADNHTDHRDSRFPVVRAYMTILDAYVAGARLDYLQQELPEHADAADMIFRRLGPPTELKLRQVARLRNAMNRWAFQTVRFRATRDQLDAIEADLAAAEAAVRGDTDDVLDPLLKKLHGHGLCHQGFFRRIEHLVSHIGAGGPVKLAGSGEGRKFTIDNLVNYVHTLGSWLAERSIEEAVGIWPDCQERATQIYETLDEPTPRKRWLVACLWKNLQDIQAFAGRGALDSEPERFALPEDALRP